MRPDIQQAPLCDCRRPCVEGESKSISTRNWRSSHIDTPFAAHHAEKIVDDGAVARELGGALIDDPHAIHPSLFRFGGGRSLSSDLTHMLNEFRDVPMRRCAAGPGRLWGCPARRPLPTTLRGRIAGVHMAH